MATSKAAHWLCTAPKKVEAAWRRSEYFRQFACNVVAPITKTAGGIAINSTHKPKRVPAANQSTIDCAREPVDIAGVAGCAQTMRS